MTHIKNILFMLLLITISCGDSSETPSISVYKVTFDSCGGTSIPAQEVAYGALITAPNNPGKASYSFSGWYKEAGYSTEWNFSTDTVTTDITLYAKWLWRDAVVFVDDFTSVQSLTNSAIRLDILYSKDYSGTISYILSDKNLGITDKAGYDASTATKTIRVITADDDISNDYIKLSVHQNTKYYVYILLPTGEIKVLTETTKARVEHEESNPVTIKIGSSEFQISFPAEYDELPDRTWPFVLSIMTPEFTYDDPNFPCITMHIGSNPQNDTTSIKNELKTIINKYRIDKTRLYATGFSAGGDFVMKLSKDDGSSDYEFNTIIATGIGTFSTNPNSGNLGTKNIWLFQGDADKAIGNGTERAYKSITWTTSEEHYLTILRSDIDHGDSHYWTWQSPYTLRWLLSK